MNTTKNFFLSLVGMEMAAAIERLGNWWQLTKSEPFCHTFNRSAGGFLEVRTKLIDGREIITHETHNGLAELYQKRDITRKFTLIPAYYEWHLLDEFGNTLHCLAFDAQDAYNEDGKPLTRDELREFVEMDLNCADDAYSMRDEYNGVLLSFTDRLTEAEMKAAAEAMGDTLYEYYIA